jgi:hypothetical protein
MKTPITPAEAFKQGAENNAEIMDAAIAEVNAYLAMMYVPGVNVILSDRGMRSSAMSGGSGAPIVNYAGNELKIDCPTVWRLNDQQKNALINLYEKDGQWNVKYTSAYTGSFYDFKAK